MFFLLDKDHFPPLHDWLGLLSLGNNFARDDGETFLLRNPACVTFMIPQWFYRGLQAKLIERLLVIRHGVLACPRSLVCGRFMSV